MKRYLKNTEFFLNREYKINNPNKKCLNVGDVCIVHPTEKSQSKKPYKVQLVFEHINWTVNPSVEICTTLNPIFKRGHTTVLNEYLFSRLEPIKK